jgi:putative membrane protein
LSKITGIETNLYDKLVHFSFGLLIVYPLREFFLRVARTSGFWSYLAPFTAVMTMASLYEIFEWVTVQNIDPKLAYMFIGGSDPFDTTKDMFSALLGTAISLGIVAVLERVDQKSSFWKNIKGSFKRDTMDAPKEDRILHKDIL